MVQNIILNTTLNNAIVKCLPSEFNISYLERLVEYVNLNPMNQEPINMFYFNAEFIKNIGTGFKVNPINFDHASNPVNMSVNAVHYGNPLPTSPPFPIPIPLSPTLSPTIPTPAPTVQNPTPNPSDPATSASTRILTPLTSL